MGHKVVCIECRLVYNKSFDEVNEHQNFICAECNKSMILLSHRFRPPKKSDDKKWEVVKYLISNGFDYNHIYQEIETSDGNIVSSHNYASYPENIRDAKEFVEKYKSQAKKIY